MAAGRFIAGRFFMAAGRFKAAELEEMCFMAAERLIAAGRFMTAELQELGESSSSGSGKGMEKLHFTDTERFMAAGRFKPAERFTAGRFSMAAGCFMVTGRFMAAGRLIMLLTGFCTFYLLPSYSLHYSFYLFVFYTLPHI